MFVGLCTATYFLAVKPLHIRWTLLHARYIIVVTPLYTCSSDIVIHPYVIVGHNSDTHWSAVTPQHRHRPLRRIWRYALTHIPRYAYLFHTRRPLRSYNLVSRDAVTLCRNTFVGRYAVTYTSDYSLCPCYSAAVNPVRVRRPSRHYVHVGRYSVTN